jgi:hypothetical protein
MSNRPIAFSRLTTAACLVLATSVAPALAQAKGEPKLPLNLTSFAVNMDARARGASTGRVNITIERWSTDGERDRLLQALIEKGSDKLLSALQKTRPRAGYVRSDNSLAWDIYYARLTPGEDGGYRLVFATDRPINFWEARNNTRTSEYEFMLCEIHMNRNGEGEGKLALMAKITWNKKTNTLELENYDTEPVRLNKVTEVK